MDPKAVTMEQLRAEGITASQFQALWLRYVREETTRREALQREVEYVFLPRLEAIK